MTPIEARRQPKPLLNISQTLVDNLLWDILWTLLDIPEETICKATFSFLSAKQSSQRKKRIDLGKQDSSYITVIEIHNLISQYKETQYYIKKEKRNLPLRW